MEAPRSAPVVIYFVAFAVFFVAALFVMESVELPTLRMFKMPYDHYGPVTDQIERDDADQQAESPGLDSE
jgi:hypothetical protein